MTVLMDLHQIRQERNREVTGEPADSPALAARKVGPIGKLSQVHPQMGR